MRKAHVEGFDLNGHPVYNFCKGRVEGVPHMEDGDYEVVSASGSTLEVRPCGHETRSTYAISGNQFVRKPDCRNSYGEEFYEGDYVWDNLGRKYWMMGCSEYSAKVMELLDTRVGKVTTALLDNIHPKPRCVDSEGVPISVGDVVEVVEDGN